MYIYIYIIIYHYTIYSYNICVYKTYAVLTGFVAMSVGIVMQTAEVRMTLQLSSQRESDETTRPNVERLRLI